MDETVKEIIDQVRQERGCNCDPDVEIIDRERRLANVRHDDWCATWTRPQPFGDLADHAIQETRRAGCTCQPRPDLVMQRSAEGAVELIVLHGVSCAMIAVNN